MKTEWLRKTIRDFEPYFVAPIAEKHVINANENYFNVLSIPAVKKELLEVDKKILVGITSENRTKKTIHEEEQNRVESSVVETKNIYSSRIRM